MSISDAKATYGLTAIGTPIGTNLSGTCQIGVTSTSASFPTADVAYSMRAVIVGSSSAAVLSLAENTTSGSTSWTAGTAQVETATVVAASGCTSNGTMALTLTCAAVSGSPLTINVPLTTTEHTTAALIAAAARSAINATAAAAAVLTAGGSGANIVLSVLPTSTRTVPGGTLNIYSANDATLNLAIPSGLGVTAAGTSTDTTAGVATAGAKIYDGDGLDFEGVDIPTAARIYAVLTEVSAIGSSLEMKYSAITSGCNTTALAIGRKFEIWNNGITAPLGTLTFTCGGSVADVTVTVIGSTT